MTVRPIPNTASRLAVGLARECLGATDDFGDLLGDLALTRSVVLARQTTDQFIGVVCRVLIAVRLAPCVFPSVPS